MTRFSSVLAVGVIAATGCGDALDAPPGRAARVVRPADDCVTASAGDGFVSLAIPNATVLDTVDFTVTVDTIGLDAVVALSAGAPASFNNLATAVRFNTSGNLDVRNGAAYAADFTQPYTTDPVRIRTIADVTSKTYSAFIGDGATGGHELAHQYAFRTTALPNHLDTLSAEVDGASGTLTVCFTATPSTGAIYSREGNYRVVPLATNTALISDGTTTQKLNAAGKTTATLATAGGELAVDSAGNVSIASVTGTTLTVTSVTSAFAPRWTATQTVPTGAQIAAITVDSTNTTRVGLAAPGQAIVVVPVSSAGVVGATNIFGGDIVAFDGTQPVVASNTGAALDVIKFTAAGAAVWSDSFTGTATVTAITVDASHNVVFGGALSTAIDFGGGTLPVRTTPEHIPFNAYWVKLSSAGAHVFSTRTNTFAIGGIATNATRIAVSHFENDGFFRPALSMYDPAGTPVATTFDTGLGDLGQGLRVAINATGRVWWNVNSDWETRQHWPYLAVVTP